MQLYNRSKIKWDDDRTEKKVNVIYINNPSLELGQLVTDHMTCKISCRGEWVLCVCVCVCVCAVGWDWVPCASNPCQNMADCAVTPGADAMSQAYQCLCPPSFTGVDCQTGAMIWAGIVTLYWPRVGVRQTAKMVHFNFVLVQLLRWTLSWESMPTLENIIILPG